MQIISEDDYLLSHGFDTMSDYTLDKCKIPHGETLRQRERRLKECDAAKTAFYAAKQALRQEYREKVKRGELRPPTTIEKLMNSINFEQLQRIRAKLLLGIPLSAFETAYYTLYGDKITEVN